MRTHELKPLGHVVTVRVDDSLRCAAETMKRESVGCVVVEGLDGRPIGMLTDRDIALNAVAFELSPETDVSGVMSQPLETVDVGEGRSAVIARMRALGVRRMPVVRDGSLVGLISLDDLAFDITSDLHELSQATASKLRHARRSARREVLVRGAEDALADLQLQLRYANWVTRERFLDELDRIRGQVAKALHRQAN